MVPSAGISPVGLETPIRSPASPAQEYESVDQPQGTSKAPFHLMEAIPYFFLPPPMHGLILFSRHIRRLVTRKFLSLRSFVSPILIPAHQKRRACSETLLLRLSSKNWTRR